MLGYLLLTCFVAWHPGVSSGMRTVGMSGKSLPEGLVQHGNPYESWGSYRDRIRADAKSRQSRQKRDARVLSRQKRFISFPTGSYVNFEPELYIPVYSQGDLGINLDTVLQFQWKLPNDTITLGRSYLADDRSSLYNMARVSLDRMGLNGKACLLRAICEAAEYPVENEGLLGEVLNIVLTSSKAQTSGSELNEHMHAEFQGRSGGNCQRLYSECPLSMFNLV